MRKNRVIYPPTISWNLLGPQRPQFILRHLANQGHESIFFDSNPPYEGAIHCNKPYKVDGISILPPNYDPTKLKPFLLYYSVPNHHYWIDKYEPNKVVYDLLDYPVDGQPFNMMVDSVKDADEILVVSDYLHEVAETYTKNTVTYVPNGVQNELYDRPLRKLNYLESIQQLKSSRVKILEPSSQENTSYSDEKKIIGYSGVIWEEVWNHDLFLEVCNEFSDDIILMTGAFFNDYGALPDNVHFLGHVPRKDLPECMDIFDVAMIPFLENDFTRAMCPLKYLEFCAMGKPTVSTPIPEVEKGPVDIGQTTSEFIEMIHKNLEEKQTKGKIKKRKDYAKKNDWNKVLEPLEKIFEE